MVRQIIFLHLVNEKLPISHEIIAQKNIQKRKKNKAKVDLYNNSSSFTIFKKLK